MRVVAYVTLILGAVLTALLMALGIYAFVGDKYTVSGIDFLLSFIVFSRIMALHAKIKKPLMLARLYVNLPCAAYSCKYNCDNVCEKDTIRLFNDYDGWVCSDYKHSRRDDR